MNESINETLLQTPTTILGTSAPFTNSPTIDIFLITLIVAVFINLINKYFTDQVKIRALRAEMKELQKKMREKFKTNPQEAQKLQQQIMKKNMENIKHAMNPKIMLITMGPLLIVFTFIGKLYGYLGEFFIIPLFGWNFGWLGTYILFSIINSIIIKKVLNVA